MIPTCHYMMGGVPTNVHGQVIHPKPDGTENTVVPGLFACGEIACVSVHVLGDAVLETVVSDIFISTTEQARGLPYSTRSKIVQREALNRLASEMGLKNSYLLPRAHV